MNSLGKALPVLTTLALAALAAGPLLFACADEPAVHCTIATGTLSAKFYPVSGDAGCSIVPGDALGVTAYVPNPTNPGDGLSKLAIRSRGSRHRSERCGLCHWPLR